MHRITYPEAAKILQVNEKTIRNWVKSGKLFKAGARFSRCSVYLEDVENLKQKLTNSLQLKCRYFEEQNERSAYWAGFIMADGNISDDSRLQIWLSRKDKNLLESLCNELCYNGSLKDSEEWNDKYQKTYLKSGLSIRNKYWLEDFKQWGICPRKTKEFIQPNIKGKYLGYYVKGLFDGDGSAHFGNEDKQNNRIGRLEIIGNPLFIDWLVKTIPIECYIGQTNENWSVLYISCSQNIKKFYYWCNGDIKPRLDRKWSLIEEILSLS